MSTTVASFQSSKPNCRQSSNAARRTQHNSSLANSRVGGPHRVDDAIHLSPERKLAMLELMKDSERRVVASMMGHPDHLTLWKPRMRQKGISYCVDENVGKRLTRFCCVGLTDAPVAEIMKMFMVTNTDNLMKNVRIMYRNVKEAKILSVLQPATRSNTNRSVYIRYANFDTPPLMSGRDICVCVCTNLIKHSDGSTVGYCLWDSVDIPECPDRSDMDKIIRSKMWHSGFFIRNSGKLDTLTKVCYIIGVEIKGPIPRLTGILHMGIFGGNCRQVCEHYRKHILDPEKFVRPEDWMPKNEVKACPICEKRFIPLVKKRYNCVRCGQGVCGHCNFSEEVSVRGAVIIRVRICYFCLEEEGMWRSNLQAIAARDNLDSFTSDGSGVRDLLRHDSTSSSSCKTP